MNSYDTRSYNDTTQSILSWKWYPEQFQKPHNLYKIKLTTSTRSHANKNKHKKDNWFREHFGQNLSSQNTRNGVSGHQDFKIFWGSMPPEPPRVGCPLHCSPDLSVIKKHKKTTRHFQRLITGKLTGIDPGGPRNLQRRKVEVTRWPAINPRRTAKTTLKSS